MFQSPFGKPRQQRIEIGRSSIGSRRPVSDELLLCIAMPVVDDMTLAPLRTRLLTPESTTYAEPRIDDYADRREPT